MWGAKTTQRLAHNGFFPFCEKELFRSKMAHKFVATLEDVEAWRDRADRPSVEHELVWGPVSSDDAASAGSARPAASVVVKPTIAPAFAAAAMQCVPADVLPRVGDTTESLVARLAASPFLDDAHVLNNGNGKRGRAGKRTRLNATSYPQPRRKSWSVRVGSEEVAEETKRACKHKAMSS